MTGGATGPPPILGGPPGTPMGGGAPGPPIPGGAPGPPIPGGIPPGGMLGGKPGGGNPPGGALKSTNTNDSVYLTETIWTNSLKKLVHILYNSSHVYVIENKLCNIFDKVPIIFKTFGCKFYITFCHFNYFPKYKNVFMNIQIIIYFISWCA